MPRITRSCIDDIRLRVNILDVVEPYITLKRSGSSYKGLSPFNPEKTPSFYVHPDKGFFKCFSSGNGGDIFKFVQLIENLEFNDAIEHIAAKFNIELQYEEGGPTQETRTLRNQLFEIYETTTYYYRECFLSTKLKDAEYVRNYWREQRKFSDELAEEFKIGFSPAEGNHLLDYLQKKKHDIDAIRQSGIFYVTGQGTCHPRFRGRLMIPIRDIQGRVIAFTARQLDVTPQDRDVEKSKYINSPETPIFVKKNMLFNLDRARKGADEEGRFLLVEGQLDALRCYEQGAKCAVAPQGSGVSEEQLILLKRHCPRLDVLLDGDRAGRQAALRVLPMALKIGMEPRFLVLPDGQDPDDLLQAGGLDALKELTNKAQDAMRFAVDSLMPPDASPQQAEEATRNIFNLITQSESELTRVDYLKRFIHASGVDPKAAEHDFQRYQSSQRSLQSVPDNTPQNDSELLTTAEEELLLLLLHREAVGEEIAQTIDYEWINSTSMEGQLLSRCLAAFEESDWPGADNLHEFLESDTERNLAYGLLHQNVTYDEPNITAYTIVYSLAKRHYDAQQRELKRLIAQSTDDPEKIRTYLTQQRELRTTSAETLQHIDTLKANSRYAQQESDQDLFQENSSQEESS